MDALIFFADVLTRTLIVCMVSVAFLGWGGAILRAFHMKFRGDGSLGVCFVLGLCMMALSLLLFHQMSPINTSATLLLLLSGWILALLGFLRWRREDNKVVGRRRCRYGLIAFYLLILMFACGKSLLPPWHYDVGLYYLTTTKWIQEYPLVPGLANLYSRLGFNQISFMFAALLNGGFMEWGLRLVNPLLLAGCLLTVPFSNSSSPTSHVMRGFPWMLGLTAILVTLAHSAMHAIPSGAPDLASAYLQLALISLFVRILFEEEEKERGKILFSSSALIALLPSVKLSNVVFGLLFALLILIYLFLQRDLMKWKNAMFGGLFGGLVLIAWMHRGVELSGYPLYPSTAMGVDVEWQVPSDVPRNEIAWIRSWARQPYAEPEVVLHSWKWLEDWWRMQLIDDLGNSLLPMVYSIFGLVLWAAFLCVLPKLRKRSGWMLFAAALMVAGSLVSWFSMAPDWRFAGALLWAIPLLFGTALIDGGMPRCSAVFVGSWAMIQFSLLFIAKPYVVDQWPLGWSAWGSSVDFLVLEHEDLFLHVPLEGDRVFDSPLPATNYVDENLRMRSSDIRDGFMLEN